MPLLRGRNAPSVAPFFLLSGCLSNQDNRYYSERTGESMIVGKVVGSVVSTRKNDNLVGSKFMVVEPLAELGNPNKKIVAVDNVGAGIGELVLVALGSAARIGCNMSEAPVDAAIVGIIDNGTGLAGVTHS